MDKPRVITDPTELIQNLHLGQYMSVEIQNVHKDRFSTTLIGMVPQKCLLLELPNIVKRGELMDRLLVRDPVIVRTICEATTGDCMAFEAAVDAVTKVPHPMFCLTIPREVVSHPLRQEKRRQTHMRATLYKDDETVVIPATIVDISEGGCRLELEDEGMLAPFQSATMHLKFVYPVSGQEAVKFVRICSQRKKGKHGISAGVAFIDALQMTA